MVDLSEISIVLAGLSVSFAALEYVLNLRSTQKNMRLQLENTKATLETRQAELFMGLYHRWNDMEFQRCWTEIRAWEWKDSKDFLEKYGPYTSPESNVKRAVLGTFFEGMGVLVKRGLIDGALADDLMSGYIISYWRKFGPLIGELRKTYGPTLGEYAEYLYNEVSKVYEREHPGEPPRFM